MSTAIRRGAFIATGSRPGALITSSSTHRGIQHRLMSVVGGDDGAAKKRVLVPVADGSEGKKVVTSDIILYASWECRQ